MLITIYDRVGNPKADISPNDSSTLVKEVQGDSILTLSFTYYEHIELDVDDYADFLGERFWLTEKYRPKQNSRKEWVYDLKLYGVESMIKRLLVIKTVDDEENPVFTLTAPPRDHVAMIVKCMNNGMGNITDWKVGQVNGTENIVIDYFGKYCDEALKEIAEKVGAEWWVEGQTVNVCKCEHGEPIALGYNKGLLSIDPGTADNVKFYTRLYPVGSSRNIDREKYGYSRLQLPGGQKYVEMNADKYGRVDHYEQSAFEDIYPRRVGIVSSVRSEVKTGEDGNPFTIYYFTDNSLPFDPNDYMIGGLVIRVSFQEGSELAGLGEEDNGTYFFEVNFNSSTREFEIITIWPYDDDTQLPGGKLVPEAGNKYILWNLRMPDEYYTLAEEEFLTAVNKYNADHNLDISVYKAPTDHVWIEDNNVELAIGSRVRLESEEYFPGFGFRDSRITKITRKVNLPSSMDIEISDALSKTSQEKMADTIADVRSYARSIGESTSLPDVIRTWDNTLPTDNNLFSARRSQREFISKNSPDRAKEKIIFDKGLETGDYIPGSRGGVLDGSGNAELLSLVVRLLLSSPKFADGLTGEGWRIWLEDGLSHLTIDKLTVRQIMTVFELLIEKVRSVGGQICVSAANGKIKEIVKDHTEYRITFETENSFVGGDLMRCQTFTNGHLKSYWVLVNSADATGVWVDEREFVGQSLPEAGDECVLMGSTTNKNRQNLILISATEDGQPRIDVLDGVHDTNFTGCLRTRLGNLDGITDDWFPADNQPCGNGLYSDNAYLRGTFLLVTGEDIKTKFEIVEGKIESMIETVRDDFVADKGYLSNPAFASGMEKWDTSNEAVFFLVGNKWIWANNNVLSKKGNSASIAKDDGRTVVRIINKYILQKNANLRSKPTFETNSDGKREALPVYLSFFYRCVRPGKITIRFEGVDKTGFENFNSFSIEEDIAATSGYVQFSCDGLWNGTGDFKLAFTGEIYLYMLVMSTDKVEALTYKYRTLFEQSEKLIKIAAQNFNKDGHVLQSSEIITTAKYNSLISKYFDDEGNLLNTAGLVTTTDWDEYNRNNKGWISKTFVSVESFAGMFATAANENGLVKKAQIAAFITKDECNELISNISLTADRIHLEGIVTANGNLQILEDGSIKAKNGVFTGVLNLSAGFKGLTNGNNIIHMPALPAGEVKRMTFPYDNVTGDIGKVIRFHNSSPFGGGIYTFDLYGWRATKDGSSGAEILGYNVQVLPQETVEITNFLTDETETTLTCQWLLTNRFGVDNFRSTGACHGRFPRVLAMGHVSFANNSVTISGDFWQGQGLSSIMTVSREEKGMYKVVFASGLMPSGYKVFACGYGSKNIDARVFESDSTHFTVCMSDDETLNDSSFDFIIFAPSWSYPMQ